MKSGYGPAALLGAIILAGGAAGAVVIHNDAKPGADLLADNYFLLCLTVAALGFLILLTAGIGFCVYHLGGSSRAADRVGPETAPVTAATPAVAPAVTAPVTAAVPVAAGTPEAASDSAAPPAETTEGTPPGFIGVKGDSLDS